VALLASLAATIALGAEDAPKGRTRPPGERMALTRLKAVHEDVVRIGRSRRPRPLWPRFHDLRAILHAHAEDSAHTGGTRAEMLADAQREGVQAILLSDHYRPPRDFINDSWRGLHEGVLFLPGSEDRGFLIHPTHSIIARMKDPTPAFIEAVGENGGLIFLSHIEERLEHPTTGLTGMEIYNRHADAKNDDAGMAALILKLTDTVSLKELEESLRRYPDELLAAQVQYPALYLAKWDAETKSRRLTGVAANDCHHNYVLIVKVVDEQTVKIGTNVDPDEKMRSTSAASRKTVAELVKGHRPGDVLARLDLDPYYRSFRNVSTHIIARELTEAAIRTALREGHAYVSHDWMCDPKGFRFELQFATAHAADGELEREPKAMLGDELSHRAGTVLRAEFPAACHIRLFNSGRVVAEQEGTRLEYSVRAPGVYRVEGWLMLDDEERGWIYSNPIYIR
jgi:hypothetical protein